MLTRVFCSSVNSLKDLFFVIFLAFNDFAYHKVSNVRFFVSVFVGLRCFVVEERFIYL